MGSVLDFIENLANWVVEKISSIINWFIEIKDVVVGKIKNLLKLNEKKIQESQNPKQVAKVIAAKKGISELQKYADNESRKLSTSDADTVDSILAEDPDFF